MRKGSSSYFPSAKGGLKENEVYARKNLVLYCILFEYTVLTSSLKSLHQDTQITYASANLKKS